MKVLDLFSGIGGFSLGLERAGMETVAFCEIDPFCRKVLRKHWPDVPIYEDIRTLDYDGPVDVICGGYPCQPFSEAGERKGAEDDRHLWPAMFEVIKTHRPTWVIGENVAGHISLGLDEVLSDLDAEDYAVQTFVIPACAVNAHHRRDRVWIIGNNSRNTRRDVSPGVSQPSALPCRGPDGDIPRWDLPEMGGDIHGIPRRVDRLRSLGNAVVPQIPELIGRAILETS